MFAPVTKCHGAANCYNTDGTFTCNCVPGWEGDGFFCNDFDECFEGSHNCHLGWKYKIDYHFTKTTKRGYILEGCTIAL